jgi:hypothetical protein
VRNKTARSSGSGRADGEVGGGADGAPWDGVMA